jgi:alkanesulfonate monooxygenase SsuD/methylene tetrahydromethanopterin reductase-like flavin-dependent oxidoreductase (luciferase family)
LVHDQVGRVRLGVSSFGYGIGPGTTIELAQHAEACGFHRFMLVESPLIRDSVSLSAAIAGATGQIGIGTGIANLYLRSAEMLALGATVAAEASQGRFVLGVGVSARPLVERLGLTWRTPGTALAETTATVRKYLAGADGKVPPSTHPVPIVWAAVGLGTTEAAGRLADGLMLYLATETWITTALARFDTAAQQAGRDEAPLERSLLLPVFLHEDLELARAAARQFLAIYTIAPHYRATFNASGFGDVGPESIPDELIDATVLAGPADHCRARLDRLAATGLNHIDLAPFAVGDEDPPIAAAQVMDSLRPATPA